MYRSTGEEDINLQVPCELAVGEDASHTGQSLAVLGRGGEEGRGDQSARSRDAAATVDLANSFVGVSSLFRPPLAPGVLGKRMEQSKAAGSLVKETCRTPGRTKRISCLRSKQGRREPRLWPPPQ
jgi:hypothetical protein